MVFQLISAEFHYYEISNFKVIAMSLWIKMGGSFFKNYNFILSFYNKEDRGYIHNIFLQI